MSFEAFYALTRGYFALFFYGPYASI